MLGGLKTLFARKAKSSTKAEPLVQVAPPTGGSLTPVVVIACGAGMAFWWWRQWARSQEAARVVEAKTADTDTDAGEVLPASTREGLDESLAVQADAQAPVTESARVRAQ